MNSPLTYNNKFSNRQYLENPKDNKHEIITVKYAFHVNFSDYY
jgi:hypothetical protein